MQATLFDPYGATVAQLELAVDGTTAQGKTHVANPMLWDGDHPNLYSLELNNPAKTGPAQLVHTRFGFRELTTADGRLFLNGKPFYMRAALDQDFYPQGIYTPPSADFIRQEMLTSKALGLNMLRCHIKVPDPRYLDAADETGMLVWYEIPVWNDAHRWTAQAAQRGVDTFRAEVERDWNHPSIVIQSIMNEQWGMDPAQADQRAWLLNSFRDFKQLTAPLGRLITDNSACCAGFHLQSDFADFHMYYSIPDHAANLGSVGTGVRRPPEVALSARMATQSPPARSRCWFRNSATGACLNCRRAINCPGGSRATLKVASSPAPPASSIACTLMAWTASIPITTLSRWPQRGTSTWRSNTRSSRCGSETPSRVMSSPSSRMPTGKPTA